MNGLFVCSVFAAKIINGTKKNENRNWTTKKLNEPIYLLTNNNLVLGIIKITKCTRVNKFYKYSFKIKVVKKFAKPKKYRHPWGAVRWVKNVRPK